MNHDRQRVEEDLRGQIAGDVRSDEVFCQLYATDAGLYEQMPLAVIRPRLTADVVAVMQYAHEHGLPVHARGAGSGLAGGAVGQGLVVDFSRYMRRILKVEGDTARVQPGVVHADLNRRLAERGRIFGPDPAMTEATTMGGVVAVDASGSHWPWYGSTRDQVLGVKVVLTDGQEVELGVHQETKPDLQPPPGIGADGSAEAADDPDATIPYIHADPTATDSPEARRLSTAVAELASRHRAVIEMHRAKSVVNSSGYALHRVVDERGVDLAKLICGSEGTLGLITEILVRTQPLPKQRGGMLLMFDSLDKAARVVQHLLPLGMAACDLMDRRHLGLAREVDVRYELIIPGAAEAVLLIDHYAEDEATLRAKLQATARIACDEHQLAAGYHIADDEDDHRLLRSLAQRFVPMLHGLKGQRRATPGIEDIAVPPSALPVFLRHLQDTLKQSQVTAALFGHAAHGQLHIRPLLDLTLPEDVQALESLATELYEKVWLLGGTVSGEHGDGLSRTPFASRQHGPLLNVFRELKRIFDPQNLLNPGKIVPEPGERMTHKLRHLEAAKPVASEAKQKDSNSVKTVELQLNWQADELAESARACNGCGACRTRSEEARMCPIFRYAPREEGSPRAKANLVRAVVTGALPGDTLQHDDVKEIADLCVHCHMCRLDCPAQVDIPKLMLEAKAAHVKANGLKPHNWWMSRIDTVSRWGSRMPWLANWMLRLPQTRWLMERTMGLASGRKMPQFAKRPFLKQFESTEKESKPRRASSPQRERVVYFVDTFANFYDVELAESFLRVLRHNEVVVESPPLQSHSGMAMISQGALNPARRVAARNVELLADYIRQGFRVVATEPSAVLALCHEYPLILDNDEDALLVAKHTQESCQYLWQLHRRGLLQLDLRPISAQVAYHMPCHVKALEYGSPATNLMRLIPELRLTRLEKGCSGMAGMYGMLKENYRSSLRAGLPLLTELRGGTYQLGVTECSTCNIQMRQSTTMPVVHPVKLLAMSYGLTPTVKLPPPAQRNPPPAEQPSTTVPAEVLS